MLLACDMATLLIPSYYCTLRNRLLNLELLQNYGASMWLGHNKAEEGTEAAVASQVRFFPVAVCVNSSRLILFSAVCTPPPAAQAKHAVSKSTEYLKV